MYISREEKDFLIRELQSELHARLDGGRKNLIVPECVWCGKQGGKLGIYVGPEKNGKTFGMAHCFSCGRTCKDINKFVAEIGRSDLQITDSIKFTPVEVPEFFGIEEDDIDDYLNVIPMQ